MSKWRDFSLKLKGFEYKPCGYNVFLFDFGQLILSSDIKKPPKFLLINM